MAHGRDGPDIVMTTRYVGMREIHAVSRHEKEREPESSSAIDPLRSHLNEILHGPATQSEAVAEMMAQGVKAPTAQAEEPYIQVVLSASPEYFRDDPKAKGTWNAQKLDDWKRATMDWLKAEYGDDLAHVSMHLDEDTPHIHVLIIPTYERKPRRPGRQRKTETVEDFEARKRAAESGETVRTVSRSSNEFWKRPWCRREARVSYHMAMQPLGLGYGKDFVGSGKESPERKETAQYVREQAQANKEDRAKLDAKRQELADQERALAIRSQVLDAAEDEIDTRDAQLDDRETNLDERESRLRSVYKRVQQLLGAVADNLGVGRTLREISDAIRDHIESPVFDDEDMSPS